MEVFYHSKWQILILIIPMCMFISYLADTQTGTLVAVVDPMKLTIDLGDSSMKSMLIAAALFVVISLPVHAQGMGSNPAGAPSGPLNRASSGGSMPSSTGQLLSHVPPAQFSTAAASGTLADFNPSIYVPYELAVEKGRVVLHVVPISVAQVAHETRLDPKLLTNFVFTQDRHGNVVAEVRQ